MANNYVDKIKTLSGTTLTSFDIYAKAGADVALNVLNATSATNATLATKATSAGSAQGINSTKAIKLSGDISGTDLSGTAISAAKTISTIIKNVPWKAISATNVSGAGSNLAYNSTAWSATNERFLTPSVVKNFVDSKTSAVAEDNGLYQVKGNTTFADLTATSAHHNGYVYNVTTTGTVPTASGYSGQTFEVQAGDNLVWIADASKPGWDKLADPFAVAKSTLKEYSAASADIAHFNSVTDTVTNGANMWDNSAHNLFSKVVANTTTLNATAYNDTLTLAGISGIGAGATSRTATFGFSNVSAFKTFKVTNSGGATANVNATTYADTITFSAGSAIQLVPTVDASGNPTITINKTDTTAGKATTADIGLVQLSYYKENDATNHIGTLVVQGNMSATNLA